MPLYLYEHPTTGEIKELIQTMSEIHEFVDDAGVKWNRVFTKPQANTTSVLNIDPNNKKEFMDRTRDLKGGTIGDLWDISAELSEKRAAKEGKDPIKEKAMKDYKKRTGKPHPFRKTNKTPQIKINIK